MFPTKTMRLELSEDIENIRFVDVKTESLVQHGNNDDELMV